VICDRDLIKQNGFCQSILDRWCSDEQSGIAPAGSGTGHAPTVAPWAAAFDARWNGLRCSVFSEVWSYGIVAAWGSHLGNPLPGAMNGEGYATLVHLTSTSVSTRARFKGRKGPQPVQMSAASCPHHLLCVDRAREESQWHDSERGKT
jgi:hypothetical protein